MTYRYRAYTNDRRLVSGNIEALNETMAEQSLYQAGIKYIVSLRAEKSRPTLASLIPSLFGVKSQDIVEFSRQLASFIESGIALHAALQLVEEQTTKRALKDVIAVIGKEIRNGSSFSQAVRRFPEQFPYNYYQIIKASEHAGNLESGLRQIADYMEKQIKIRAGIRRALAYPAVVTVMAIGIFVLMITMVLPPILSLFSSLGADLPWTTRLMMGMVNFFADYLWQIAVVVVLIVFGIFIYTRLPAGKLALDKMALKLPVLSRIIIQRTMAHFCRTTNMMLRSGMQLPEIIDVATQTASSNRVIIKALSDLRLKLVEGQGLSRPMSENPLFPPTMVKMLAMGEQTGTIDEATLTLANFYEERANQSVQSLISTIEPTITIIMGLGVAFILVAILMPMYTVLSSLR